MKTDDLIQALATDLPPTSPGRLTGRLLTTLVPAALLVLAAVGLWLGFRADLDLAMRGLTFWAKATYTASLALGGFWLLGRAGRPGADARPPLLLVGLLLAAVGGLALAELAALPPTERMDAIMGDSARACAPNILILSALAAPLIFWAARAFAPTRSGLAGAAAGLLSAGLAATLYGLHCPEHTAAFVAIWYTAGIAMAVAAGAVVGRFCFRW